MLWSRLVACVGPRARSFSASAASIFRRMSVSLQSFVISSSYSPLIRMLVSCCFLIFDSWCCRSTFTLLCILLTLFMKVKLSSRLSSSKVFFLSCRVTYSKSVSSTTSDTIFFLQLRQRSGKVPGPVLVIHRSRLGFKPLDSSAAGSFSMFSFDEFGTDSTYSNAVYLFAV